MEKGLIFTYLMTYGGTFASLFSPFIGLLVYVCFAIIKPEALWYWVEMPANSSRIVAVGLLAGWIIHGLGRWNLGRAWAIVLSLLGFLAWSCFVATRAQHQDIAWTFIENQLKIILPFVVGITTISSVGQLRALAWTIVLSQGYVAFELNLSYLGGYNRLQEVGFATFDNNTMAISIDTCIGMAFFLGLHSKALWQKLLAWFMAACMAHAVMFSFSRGAMLGMIMCGLVSFIIMPKTRATYWTFALAMLVGLRMAGPEVLKRFSTAFGKANETDVPGQLSRQLFEVAGGKSSKDTILDSSAALRLKNWKACLDSMRQNPLGIGPRHWPFECKKYDIPKMEAHSNWLQTGAELGIPGLALLLVFYVLCGLRLWPLSRERGPPIDPELRALARMAVASLVGFGVSACFVTVPGIEAPYYVTLLGAGVLKLHSLSQVVRRPAVPLRTNLRPRPLAGARA
jgi:O-antigen ligase